MHPQSLVVAIATVAARRLSWLVPAALLAGPAVSIPAQVPEGDLVASSFGSPGLPGSGGLWFVGTRPPHAVTPITGLPAALTGISGGANCVLRDPDTEDLVCGSVVLNGGSIAAFMFSLNGSAVIPSSIRTATIGTVLRDGGVNAVARVGSDDYLLGVGPVTGGAFAFQPLLRWKPSTNAVIPVQLPGPYAATGNMCNAVILTADGKTVVTGLRQNNATGPAMVWDIVALPLAGGPHTVIATLAMGEFPTQLAWTCNGELLAVTAQFPMGTGGRILNWAKLGTWTQTSAIRLPGLLDINGTCVDPASCTVYLNPGVFKTTPGRSDLYAWQGGMAAPTLVSAGPAGGWGVVSGLDINPNPEVTERPSGSGLAPSWVTRPFPGGTPNVGNATFSLRLGTGALGTLSAAFLSAQRAPKWLAPPNLDIFLAPGSLVLLGAAGGPNPLFSLPIPNNQALKGFPVFAQAITLDSLNNFSASDLLSITIQ